MFFGSKKRLVTSFVFKKRLLQYHRTYFHDFFPYRACLLMKWVNGSKWFLSKNDHKIYFNGVNNQKFKDNLSPRPGLGSHC